MQGQSQGYSWSFTSVVDTRHPPTPQATAVTPSDPAHPPIIESPTPLAKPYLDSCGVPRCSVGRGAGAGINTRIRHPVVARPSMTAFNVFHVLGDVSHTTSKLILIWAIHSNSSAEGPYTRPRRIGRTC